ncbi:hypothetical protein HAPAU_26040 [Halalkalicoccus paucihalophilus]|uniref:Uncharacterized protein n=1 Tax=Halalkalicoccus paucihalophilus TaxID=1008153 RepID=A0A151AE28_9EURY|nr:hypothetical protein HAPAU_26040 [Halalkalicoccus paucihalophilus]
MSQCNECGNHVTADFHRVFADNEGGPLRVSGVYEHDRYQKRECRRSLIGRRVRIEPRADTIHSSALGLTDDQHRQARSDDGFGRTPEEDRLERRFPLRAHDDEVDPVLVAVGSDHLRGHP